MGVILFLDMAYRNSRMGQRMVHALICLDDWSNIGKASLKIGIRVARSVVLASKIVVTTMGGMNRTFLQCNFKRLVAVSVRASTSSFVSAI